MESGLDFFGAAMRDMFKKDHGYGIYKNYNNMRTINIILQGHEQKQNHWGQYLAILTEQAWSIKD